VRSRPTTVNSSPDLVYNGRMPRLQNLMTYSSRSPSFHLFLASLLGVSLLSLFLLVLQPLTITGFAEEKGDPSRLVIRNNELSGSGFGIYIGPRDEEVIIKGNTLRGNAEAIRLTGVKDRNLVTGNRIVDNLAGVTLRNYYSDNDEGYVKYPVDREDIRITDNTFSGNEAGNVINMLEDSLEGGQAETKGSSETDERAGSAANNSEAETSSQAPTQTGTDETSSTGADTEGASRPEPETESESISGGESSEEANGDREEAAAEPGTEAQSGLKEDDNSSGGSTEETSEVDGTSAGSESGTETQGNVDAQESEAFPPESRDLDAGSEESGDGDGSPVSPEGEAGTESDDRGSGSPYVVAGTIVVGLTTLLLVLRSNL